MEFIPINESEYKNEQFLVRSYSGINGSFKTNYESIKNNCLFEKKYCLVEVKTEYYTLGWDFDFKDKLEKKYLDNHEQITRYIITKINEILDEYIIMPNKDYVYAESTNGNGKHIYYVCLIVNRKFNLFLYDKLTEKIKNEKIYDTDNIKKIIDKSVCAYNGIRLFGCEYEGGSYYPNKEKSTYKITGDISKDFNYCLLNKTAIKCNFDLKIILEEEDDEEIIVLTDKINNTHIDNLNNKIIPYKKNFDKKEDFTKITDLLIIIRDKNKEYEDWLGVGMALFDYSNSENMMNVWFEWSSYNYKCDYMEIRKKWKSFKPNVPNPKTIKTICKMARDANYNLYIEWYNKYYKNEIINLIRDFDQQTVAVYFKNKKPNNYIYKKGTWYALLPNGLWKEMHKNENSKLINDITETVKEEIIELKNNLRPEDDLLKIIPPTSKRLGTSKFIYGVIDYLREKYRNDEDNFNKKSNLFGFNNIVYDLEKNEWREYLYTDMVTMTVGYNWKEPKKQEIKLIDKIIKQIQSNEEIRNFYLDILCSGLWGTTLQHYIIFNGFGGNGKSVIDDLLIDALGEYCHLINSKVLCQERKTGADTDLANLRNKRLIFAREPAKAQNVKLSNSLLKELTGSSFINARKIYDTDDKTPLCLTLIIECNKKPLLEEEPTEADLRRLIDLSFDSKFTDDKTLINHNANIYEKNIFYTTAEFRETYKYAILHYLFEHNKSHYKKELVIPETVKNKTENYMKNSIELFEWFNETFEKINEYTENDYVSMCDLYDAFKNSEYYQTLNKNEKRNYTKNKIIAIFKDNPLYKKLYFEECEKRHNIEKEYFPKRIEGYKLKNIV